MAKKGRNTAMLGLPRDAAASAPGDMNAESTHTGDETGGALRTFFEDFNTHCLPWIAVAGVVAVILWQQHTTMELIERINARYLR